MWRKAGNKMKLKDGLRTIFLAGVGAVAITGEKASVIIDDLVKMKSSRKKQKRT